MQRGFPVVAVKNASGNFALPSAANVAIALTKATLNSDNTQNLDGVYANADKAAYPISSYSTDHANGRIEPRQGSRARQVHALLRLRWAAEGSGAWVLTTATQPADQVVFDAVKRLLGTPVPAISKATANPTLSGTLGQGHRRRQRGRPAAATGGRRWYRCRRWRAAAATGQQGGTAAAAAAGATDAGNPTGATGRYAALQTTSLSVNAGAGSGPSLIALLTVCLVIHASVGCALEFVTATAFRGPQ